MEIFFFALILGVIPAMIASSKGYNWFGWWIYGVLLFIIALVHAILLKPKEKILLNSGENKRCPYCSEIIKSAAKICKHCHKPLRCPYCAEIVESAAKICSHCHKPLMETD